MGADRHAGAIPETLILDETVVPCSLRRSSRRRTLGLTVTADAVRIHAPSGAPASVIMAYVTRQQGWILRAWRRLRAHQPPSRPDLDSVTYLGVSLRVETAAGVCAGVTRRGRRLVVVVPPGGQPQALVRAWLQARAERVLGWRLLRLARRGLRQPTRFALSDARTRWGSCTREGTIRLNWRLVQAPLALIDYVAAHELAHLVHLDHSPRFWNEVARLCPQPKARRAALRHMAPALFAL